jgi:DNA-binding MarR family transcriptional regulator
MRDNSLSEFADKILSVLRVFTRGFGKKHTNELCQGKITMPQFIILDFISTQHDVMMTDVAKHLEISTAAVTGMMDRLQKSGYLGRVHDVKDRRIVRLKLTSKGKKLVVKIHEERRQMIITMFSKISQSERDEYLRILTKIKDAIVGGGRG